MQLLVELAARAMQAQMVQLVQQEMQEPVLRQGTPVMRVIPEPQVLLALQETRVHPEPLEIPVTQQHLRQLLLQVRLAVQLVMAAQAVMVALVERLVIQELPEVLAILATTVLLVQVAMVAQLEILVQ